LNPAVFGGNSSIPAVAKSFRAGLTQLPAKRIGEIDKELLKSAAQTSEIGHRLSAIGSGLEAGSRSPMADPIDSRPRHLYTAKVAGPKRL
jgi:hypothetical protein